MTANYGVNVTTSVDAARPISVEGKTVIAIAGTEVDSLGETLRFFPSAQKALETLNAGSIKQACRAIDAQAVKCSIIVRPVKIDQAILDTPGDFHGDPDLKAKLISAVEDLKKANAELGYSPDVILCPGHSGDQDIVSSLLTVAIYAAGIVVADLDADDEVDAINAIKNYSSKRLIPVNPRVRVFDIDANDSVFAPASPYLAGLIAQTDAAWEYGFADSFSNRLINGISGLERPVDFAMGQDSEADRLRTAKIATIIRSRGFRFWGGENTATEPIWQDITRVRVFDKLGEAFLDGLYWAIDRRANILKAVKDSVEELLLALKGNDVLIDYEVIWDEEKNTKVTVTQGKFYLNVATANVPIVKQINIDLSYTDRFNASLIERIQ